MILTNNKYFHKIIYQEDMWVADPAILLCVLPRSGRAWVMKAWEPLVAKLYNTPRDSFPGKNASVFAGRLYFYREI